jgi:hypothetical protein
VIRLSEAAARRGFGDDDGEVVLAGLGVGHRVLAVEDVQHDVDERALAAEAGEQRRERVAADRHARAEDDAALRAVRQALEVPRELAGAAQEVAGPDVHRAPALREVHPPALAVEQARAEALLERSDVRGDDGLRDVEAVRGAADAAELDDKLEDLELVQRDAAVDGHGHL